MGLIVPSARRTRLLAPRIGQLVIQLDKADGRTASSCRSSRANSDFGELARSFPGRGAQRVAQRLRSRHGQVLSFKDDKGTTIELFKEWSYLAKHAQVAGIGPLKLGTSPSSRRTSNAPWRSMRRCWASASPIGSAISSASCAATPIITRELLHGPNAKLHHMPSSSRISCISDSCDVMGEAFRSSGSVGHGPGHNIADLSSQSGRAGGRVPSASSISYWTRSSAYLKPRRDTTTRRNGQAVDPARTCGADARGRLPPHAGVMRRRRRIAW